MSYLLDTCAWKSLFLRTPLAPRARVLADPATPLHLLDVSFLEIAKAVESGTLELNRPLRQWLRDALAENVTVLPVSPEIAALACELRTKEGFPHKDPFDQLICACARVQGLTLVTRDGLIIKWGGVPTLVY